METINKYIVTQEEAKNRLSYIGGSEIAAILGVSQYNTQLDIYLRKTGKEIDDKIETNEMLMGKLLEPVIIQRYELATNNIISDNNKFFRHPDISFLGGHIDGIINNEGIIECKSTNQFYQNTWEYDIPIEYYCQLQHYINIAGLDWGEVAILINGRTFQHFQYTRDDNFINFIENEVSNFWNNHILADIPPEPSNVNDIHKLYRQTNGDYLEAAYETIELIKKHKQLKVNQKEIETEISEIQEKLILAIREHDGFTDGLNPILTYKFNKPSRIFDKDNFKNENPELFEKYLTEKSGARVFINKYKL